MSSPTKGDFQAQAVLRWKDYLSFRYDPRDQESSALWAVASCMQGSSGGIHGEGRTCHQEAADKAREYTLMASPIVNLNYYPRCRTLTSQQEYVLTLIYQQSLFSSKMTMAAFMSEQPMMITGFNIGDILQITSNDRYKIDEHRVVANGSKNRVSVPNSMNPGAVAVFGPLPEVLENGEQPLYKESLFSDYFKYLFSKKHEGEKTMDFARI